jgi:hypothetical protein
MQFLDINIEKVMDDQKIMLENNILLNEYHKIAQKVEILLDCH